MALKDLIDALDGSVGEISDLSTRLKEKSSQDLRATMIQEKYRNRISSQQSNQESSDGFLIEGLPSSGKLHQIDEPPARKPKTAADDLLEALNTIPGLAQRGTEPVSEEVEQKPRKPRQLEKHVQRQEARNQG